MYKYKLTITQITAAKALKDKIDYNYLVVESKSSEENAYTKERWESGFSSENMVDDIIGHNENPVKKDQFLKVLSNDDTYLNSDTMSYNVVVKSSFPPDKFSDFVINADFLSDLEGLTNWCRRSRCEIKLIQNLPSECKHQKGNFIEGVPFIVVDGSARGSFKCSDCGAIGLKKVPFMD